MRRRETLAVVTVAARLVLSPPPPGVQYVSVSAGAAHMCALSADGDAYCWGSNRSGQLGIGVADTNAHSTPIRVSGAFKFASLAAGFSHTCGLLRDGAAICWGANDGGQLGDGTLVPRASPVRVASDLRFASIGPGGTHTCAVTADGRGFCWGGNWHGQIGDGTREGDTPCCHLRPVPVRTSIRFNMLGAGGIHTCGIAVDSLAYCWGTPQEGRLGTGAADARNRTVDKTLPQRVLVDARFVSLALRAWDTCAVAVDGAAYCWGGANRGMLGIGSDAADQSTPARVALRIRVSRIATGQHHTCALDAEGIAYCWGGNSEGALGDGTTTDASGPRRVVTDRRFTSIAAGGNLVWATSDRVVTWDFTCGLTRDGAILCWGDNRDGELGTGTTRGSLVPVMTTPP